MNRRTSSAVRGLGSALLVALAIGTQIQDRPPLKLKPGDTVAVTTPYGGEMTVQSDGAVYGKGFRVVLEGRTLEQAQEEMRRAMRPYVKVDDVYVTIVQLRSEVVYVVGLGGGRGPVGLVPDMTLRQLLSTSDLGADADRVEAQLYRNGVRVASVTVSDLLSGGSDQKLLANDVVTLNPAPYSRVWVLGQVQQPGELKLPAGSDVYKAIAAAGGYRANGSEWETTQVDEVRVTVRRGPQSFELPLRPNGSEAPFVLEAGDTVSVMALEAKRVTVLGEVERPGEFVLRGNQSLLAAVAAAGGANAQGTMSRVLVMRKGELFQLDAVDPKKGAFPMESGDVVYMERNERAFTVLGQVNAPGKFLFKDGETVRVTDALARAGGLNGKGTMRRVYLARPDESGKTQITMFHLDDFLKFGKLESNPEVLPGDYLMFGQPKGVTLGGAIQAISGGILLNSLVGN